MTTSSTDVRSAPPGRRVRFVTLGAAALAFLPVLASAQPPMPISGPEPAAQMQAVMILPSVRFTGPEVAARRFRFTLTPAELSALQQNTGSQAAGPACPGCPARRPGVAIVEVLGINVLYNLMNLAIKPSEEKQYFRVGFSSWWENLRYGFEWDDNAFG